MSQETPRSSGFGTPRDDRFASPRSNNSGSSNHSVSGTYISGFYASNMYSTASSGDEWATPRQGVGSTASMGIFSSSDGEYLTPRGSSRVDDGEITFTNRKMQNRQQPQHSVASLPIHNIPRPPSSRKMDDSPSYGSQYNSNSSSSSYGYGNSSINNNAPPYYSSQSASSQYNAPYYGNEIDDGGMEMEQLVEEIFSYARHSRLDDLENLLSQGRLHVDIRDSHGNTLLITACQNGNKRIAKALLRRSANINARNHKGNTALHYAFHFGYGSSIGEYLISKGADVNIRNNFGKTCYEGI